MWKLASWLILFFTDFHLQISNIWEVFWFPNTRVWSFCVVEVRITFHETIICIGSFNLRKINVQAFLRCCCWELFFSKDYSSWIAFSSVRWFIVHFFIFSWSFRSLRVVRWCPCFGAFFRILSRVRNPKTGIDTSLQMITGFFFGHRSQCVLQQLNVLWIEAFLQFLNIYRNKYFKYLFSVCGAVNK